MKKELNGSELVGFIKERQAKAVRGLVQQWKVMPKLAIIRTNPEKIVDSYMRIKQNYGADIGIKVDVYTISQSEAVDTIKRLNNDDSVHGIIVQIPLPDPKQTTEVLNTVDIHKDTDGLAENSKFDAPTPIAISWLLAGYNVELVGKNIVIVGSGRLVGRPLQKMWLSSGYQVTIANRKTEDLGAVTRDAEVLVTATGVPALITADMVREDAVIVDAGVATNKNGLVGDVDEEVRAMLKISITPQKGGVGPLTVAALFENVITAARLQNEAEQNS